MIPFPNSEPSLILRLLPRMPCCAHLARSPLSWTLSSRKCLQHCLLSEDHYPGLRKTRRYNTGRSHLPTHPTGLCRKPEQMHSLWKDSGTNSNMSSTLFHRKFSSRRSNFLYLPEENNDRKL